MTSSQGEGDQDLYVSFDGSKQPGHDHYDYHSSLSSSSVDEITVSAGKDSSHFCVGCYVYIAVYGFTHGHYSITATSKGITTLQTGRTITGMFVYLYVCMSET